MTLWQKLLEAFGALTQRRWWRLLEKSAAQHPNNLATQIAAVQTELSALRPSQIEKFAAFYQDRLMRLLSADLWYVGYIVTSNYPEGGYPVMACFIVFSGKEKFEEVLKSPVAVAKMKLPTGVSKDLARGFIHDVYLSKTGKKLVFNKSKEERYNQKRKRFVIEARALRKTAGAFDNLKGQFWDQAVADKSTAANVQRLMPIWETLAEGGHPFAQFYIAAVHWFGKSVTKDNEKALKYFGIIP